MANAKISQLPAAGAITGAELVPVVQGGTTSQTTVDDILTGTTLTNIVLGTPASGTLTNCTGLPISTGVSGLGGNVATFLATPSSANLAAAVTGETGTGALVFATSPTLVTPTLGVAAATSINKMAITAPATGSTLAVADGKTATISNTLTFTGTDSSSVAFGTGGTVAYTANNLSVFAATTSLQLAGVISDETGSGALVFGTGPTISAPVLTLKVYTAAALAALTPALGDIAVVTGADAALAWGDAVTAVGSADTTYQVWYNGTAWTVTGK